MTRTAPLLTGVAFGALIAAAGFTYGQRLADAVSLPALEFGPINR